jgi:hypothetical protein
MQAGAHMMGSFAVRGQLPRCCILPSLLHNIQPALVVTSLQQQQQQQPAAAEDFRT